MVQLIVTVTTRPNRVKEYVGAFRAIAPRVRSEEGCLEYEIYHDASDPRFDNEVRPDTVVLCEKWESIDALQRHTRESVALNEFRKVIKEIKLRSTYQLLVLAASD